MVCQSLLADIAFASTAWACSHSLYGRQAPTKTAIINANVWNGSGYTPNSTVVIVNGLISNANPANAIVYDAAGGYLLPGFIDTHCHVQNCSDLNTLRQYGVTTALDMGTYPYSSILACRASGLTDVYGPGAGATVNGTDFSHFPDFPSDSFCPNVTAGQLFVKGRLEQGGNYIKVLLDPLGPSNATISAIVQAAHAAGKLVISHAPTYADYSQAEFAGVDIPCHAPLDEPLDASSVARLIANKAVVAPTLIMMQSIVNNTGQPFSHYTANAEGSVTSMYKAKPECPSFWAPTPTLLLMCPPTRLLVHPCTRSLSCWSRQASRRLTPSRPPLPWLLRPSGCTIVAPFRVVCALTWSCSRPTQPSTSETPDLSMRFGLKAFRPLYLLREW